MTSPEACLTMFLLFPRYVMQGLQRAVEHGRHHDVQAIDEGRSATGDDVFEQHGDRTAGGTWHRSRRRRMQAPVRRATLELRHQVETDGREAVQNR